MEDGIFLQWISKDTVKIYFKYIISKSEDDRYAESKNPRHLIGRTAKYDYVISVWNHLMKPSASLQNY